MYSNFDSLFKSSYSISLKVSPFLPNGNIMRYLSEVNPDAERYRLVTILPGNKANELIPFPSSSRPPKALPIFTTEYHLLFTVISRGGLLHYFVTVDS